jgi:hypothetical protein
MFQLFRRFRGEENQFPNWSVRLLNFPFPHADPDAFATRGENLDFISAYADFIAPPIRCGVAVTALRCRDGAPGMAPVGPRVGDPERMVRNQSASPFKLYNNFNYIRVRRFILNGAPSTTEHFPEKG